MKYPRGKRNCGSKEARNEKLEASEKLSLAKPRRRKDSIVKSFCHFASGEAILMDLREPYLKLFRNLNYFPEPKILHMKTVPL